MYETPGALRTALEQRLLNRSGETGMSIDPLRRRVIFERIVARLHVADPGRWVLKGVWRWRCGCETVLALPKTSTSDSEMK